MQITLILVLFSLWLFPAPVLAQTTKSCDGMDRDCLIKALEQTLTGINNPHEKDRIYRKFARTLTHEGNPDRALALLPLINSGEEKALAMGDIGKASVEAGMTSNRKMAVFQKLLAEAKATKNDKARASAFGQVGIAQAFAGDITGAQSSIAQALPSQKDKFLGMAGGVVAQRGDLEGAITLFAAIVSQSYRNRALDAASNLFLKKAQINEAYACASRIDNAYLRAEAIQRILDRGNAEKISVNPDDELLKALDATP